MFKRVAHVCIGSVNLAETEHFYCTILGMKKGFDFIKDDKPFGFYVEAGETTFIEVFSQADTPHDQRALIGHFCLEVEDIDTVITTVRERGWTITDKKKGCDQSWQCWITDPSGVRIEMMQYTPESSQFTGNPCQVNW